MFVYVSGSWENESTALAPITLQLLVGCFSVEFQSFRYKAIREILLAGDTNRLVAELTFVHWKFSR